MPDQFSNAQEIRKPAVTSRGGIVAGQSRKAAEVGAAVLAAGGDCVDTGHDLTVQAVEDGKRAAEAIDRYLAKP